MLVVLGLGFRLLGYAISLCTVLLILVLMIYSLYILVDDRNYSHLPGPKPTSFFMGHYPIIKEFMTKANLPSGHLWIKWYNEYGLIFRYRIMHTTVIMCLDSVTSKDILTDSVHTKPKAEYKNFASVFGTRLGGRSLLSEWNHARWLKRRVLFNPAFHRSYLRGMMDMFNDSAGRLADNLQRSADGVTEVCMLDKFLSISLDIIGKVGFGLDFNSIEDSTCPILSISALSLKGIQTAWFTPWNSFMPTKEARNFRQSVREAGCYFRQFARNCIRDRLVARSRGEVLPRDILTYILDASEELHGDQSFGLEEMVDEFLTFFVAGQETTGNHLAFTLQQICRYPEVLQRILTEQEEVLGDRPFVSYQDLPKLQYLSLVMKESLRQYPPVSWTSRVTGREMECCGYKIPTGSRVRISHQVMCKMERYFDNPEDFIPERFHDTKEKARYRYAYIPFSMGHRVCIGQAVALMETKVILSHLLRRFKFELVPGQRFILKRELTNRPIDGCKTYITLRE